MTSTIVANLAQGINRFDPGSESSKKNPRCSGDSLSDRKKSAVVVSYSGATGHIHPAT
jgi:hypothetical protein